VGELVIETLPDFREVVIVVGTTVRKSPEILKAHLESLAYQELPPRVRLVPVYVPDFVDGQQESLGLLIRWVNERGGELIQGIPPQGPDFSDAPGLDAHQWGQTAMARVGENKNRILRRALELKADYVFLCDSDLILDRTTVASLLSVDRPIVTATYWTRWQKQRSETQKVYAAPQVWLRHPYFLDGRGMDEGEFRAKLLSREVTRVWGFGACTLIKRSVIEAGVSFEYLPDVPLQGLMGGEDRHFCIRAERLHIDAWADNWPCLYHIYHGDDDVPRIPEMAARLGAPHPVRARLGDLVSLRLRPLEPLQVGPGRYQHSPPVLARGRLGAMEMLPEIEEAVYGMDRGTKRIVRATFPLHHPMGQMRGRQRLIEVELVDCKPMSYPPVVDEDVLVGTKSKRIMGESDAA
jgi:hypothetical protein